MAATVSNILEQIEATAAATLDPPWHEVPNVFNLAGTDVRRGAKAYGVRPLPANSAASVTNSYALDHAFELVLMDSNPKRDDDAGAIAVIGDLYDKQDEILKAMMRTKLNLAGTVLLISEPTLSEPEFLASGALIALRQQFNVRYRQTI
jgi:hypothetical protein